MYSLVVIPVRGHSGNRVKSQTRPVLGKLPGRFNRIPSGVLSGSRRALWVVSQSAPSIAWQYPKFWKRKRHLPTVLLVQALIALPGGHILSEASPKLISGQSFRFCGCSGYGPSGSPIPLSRIRRGFKYLQGVCLWLECLPHHCVHKCVLQL